MIITILGTIVTIIFAMLIYLSYSLPYIYFFISLIKLIKTQKENRSFSILIKPIIITIFPTIILLSLFGLYLFIPLMIFIFPSASIAWFYTSFQTFRKTEKTNTEMYSKNKKIFLCSFFLLLILSILFITFGIMFVDGLARM